ncbi:MAG: type I-E CRISPR-associated protein Cse2/CasB [Chloroflexi bacterium]|nr:type I-E CRISPR-associated protein Cse2/CasB [Chloroflexota bacterium]
MTKEQPFVTYLESLRENRAALAALRRGLGQPPGAVREMYPYVAPWVPEGTPRYLEEAYYLLACLFAYHPTSGGSGNLGEAFRRSPQRGEDTAATERRFAALLAAHPEDLPFYLRQAVSFLKSREVPVDWGQLLSDLLAWGAPDGFVQKRWARSFWSRPVQPDEAKPDGADSGEASPDTDEED